MEYPLIKVAIDVDRRSKDAFKWHLRLRQDRLQESLAAFQKVSSAENADPLSLCMTGYVLEKLGRPNEAIQYYGKALKRNPNDELANKLMAGIQLHD